MVRGVAVEWTETMDATVKAMWHECTRAEICDVLGVTEAVLYRRGVQLGLGIKKPMASHGGRVMTDEMRNQLATRKFAVAYCMAAPRNGWVVRDYRGD